MIAERFPGTTSMFLSRLIKEVFPNSDKKRRGKEKVCFVVGIEQKSSLPGTLTSDPLSATSASDSVAVMSTSSSLSGILNSDPHVSMLLLELQTEREKRAALEVEVGLLKRRLETVESAADYQHKLCSEVDGTVSAQNILLHGPDTVAHFHDFSMSSVVAELQASCPHIYSLMQRLGSTQRYVHVSDDALPDEELKGVMAICTLLNARSARIKGMQLMISLMLVARASGKQVYTCIYTHTNT